MSLKAFLSSLPDEEARRSFAVACETSVGHIRNCIYQGKDLAPASSVLVEIHTAGQVRRWHCRPNDWHRIWPELIGQPGAPAIVAPVHHLVMPQAVGLPHAA
jgi:hypothetical protein